MNINKRKPRAKTTSGKEGSLMDVVTDKDYGKNTIGEPKKKLSMNAGRTTKKRMSNASSLTDANGNPISTDTTSQASNMRENMDSFRKNMDEKIREIKNYNEYLYHLEPKYKELQLFNGNILVRLKRIPMFQTVTVGDNTEEIYAPVMIPKPSAGDPSGREGTKVEHPYPYTNVGVVVSSDSDKVAVGDTVQLTHKAMDIHWNPVSASFEWPSAFYHHFDGVEHRGYVLIREYDLEAKLNEQV